MAESAPPYWLTEPDGLLNESLKRGYIQKDKSGNIILGIPPSTEEHEAFQVFYIELLKAATAPFN